MNISSITSHKFALAFATIVLLLGSTSAFASTSLPGSPLYPVKIHINEKIQSLLAVTPKAKAEIEAEHANLRLVEAETLASEDKLTDVIRVELENDFTSHVNEVNKNISQLQDRGEFDSAASISSDFESTLHSHHRTLSDISDRQNQKKSRESIDDFRDSVELTLASTTELREQSETRIASSSSIDTEAQAQNALTRAQAKIEDAKKSVRKKDRLSQKSAKQIETNLNEAGEYTSKGKTKFDSGNYGEAYLLFKKADRKAQESQFITNAPADTISDQEQLPEIKGSSNGEETKTEIRNNGRGNQHSQEQNDN